MDEEKQNLTDRDILNRALQHKSGQVPIDFGSTATTGIHVSVVAKLREHYGLEEHPVKVIEPYQMLGEVEPDLRQAMGINVVGVQAKYTIFGFPLGNWKQWKTPWGQEVLVPGDFNVSWDGDDALIYPEGDTSVEPSGRMPDGGFFFDTIVRQEPIVDEELDPQDNLEEFGPITDEELDHHDAETTAAEKTGCGVIANFGGTGFGDIALVPGPFLKHPRGIRDIAEWYMSTAMRRDYVKSVFNQQREYALANLERIEPIVGDRIDAVFICGTDFGTQDSLFCSPETFDELWLPQYKAINDWIHEHTEWKTFKHCCGAAERLMSHFIEAGFDIINPVQCSAAGMDPSHLKSSYGGRLVFWGGGVDTQKTLPFGSPEEVREQVLRRCGIFAPRGGFVFNSIHNVVPNTPVDNAVAMIDAVHEFNGYSV